MLKRLRYLRNLEALNVALLPAAFSFVWITTEDDVGWTLRLLAFVPLCYILVQGSFYWHLKIRSVVTGASLPGYFFTVFRFFKLSNALALGAPFIVLLVSVLLVRASVADIAWSGGLLAFSALEHINYYVYQLMHDTPNDLKYLARHRRLRRAPLAEDLSRGSHRAR